MKSAIADRVVPIVVDAEREESADLAQLYGIRGIPTLLLVEPGGMELARGGFMSAEQLLDFIKGQAWRRLRPVRALHEEPPQRWQGAEGE